MKDVHIYKEPKKGILWQSFTIGELSEDDEPYDKSKYKLESKLIVIGEFKAKLSGRYKKQYICLAPDTQEAISIFHENVEIVETFAKVPK